MIRAIAIVFCTFNIALNLVTPVNSFTFAPEVLMSSQSQVNNKSGVLIIGGGPSGLAAALMFAKRGWNDITVVESRSSAGYFEPDKGFSYRINERGQKVLDSFNLMPKLIERSVSDNDLTLTQIVPGKPRKSSKVNFGGGKMAYWLLRQEFISVLYNEIISERWKDKISILHGTKCVDFRKVDGTDFPYEAFIEQLNEKAFGYVPPTKVSARLVVGADGLTSMVRAKLAEWDIEHGGTGQGFQMKKSKSGSTGLKYKVLSIPPKFRLSNDPEDTTEAVSSNSYAVKSIQNGRKSLKLGILPTADVSARRTANVICWPSHEVWGKKTGEEIFRYLEKSFPQVPIRDWLTLEECETFVNSEGGLFPAPQNCQTLQWVDSPTDDAPNRLDGGVVLVGDAIHCFPPDIGQGVNSALEDVQVLEECMNNHDDNIKMTLLEYQKKRYPEAKALTRLVKLAYPWQYKQNAFREKLWLVNFVFRMSISKVFPKFFSPQAIILNSKAELSFSEMVKLVDSTSKKLLVIFATFILGVVSAVRFAL